MELKNVRKIGAKTLNYLNTHNIYTPKDLLLRFPKKYTFYQVDNINAFSGDAICFKAIVDSRPVWIKTVKNTKAFIFYALVNNIRAKCVIFSGDYLRYRLNIGTNIICYGKYKRGANEFSLINIFFEDFVCKIELDYGIDDVPNSTITGAIRNIIDNNYLLEDNLPIEYINKYKLGNINEIIKLAHFPNSINDCRLVRRRIRYEDFFWYTASLAGIRQIRGLEEKTGKVFDENIIVNFINDLPYELTIDQKNVIAECLNDLKSTKIMNRLIEGDVGSGKSIVAFICAYAAILAGYQVALMAPTEILAKQHYYNAKKLFPDLCIELLTASLKQKEKGDILYRLPHGRIDLLIGTHSIIEDSVVFKNLGLAIIDEQHRFGVNQRRRLLDKFEAVDALYLTATPIPRTLGLTNFGDLDLSIIKTMPKGRKQVITKIIPMDRLSDLVKKLERHLLLEEQIYIVVPLIEENDRLDFIDINQALEIFSNLLPNARIDILHGKMKSDIKDEIMNSFKSHNLDILISTTVIEVGVDVENASVMVILDAERYGLSQIHQLRGRVGRGNIQSYCYLVTDKDYVERLDILEKTIDGFLLAEEDLRLRGPGDFLGEEQSGFNSLNFDFESNDLIIWKCALEDSREYVNKYFNNEVENSRLDIIFEQISGKKTKIN